MAAREPKFRVENTEIRRKAEAGAGVYALAARYRIAPEVVRLILRTDDRVPVKRRATEAEMARRTALYAAQVAAGEPIRYEPQGPAADEAPSVMPMSATPREWDRANRWARA